MVRTMPRVKITLWVRQMDLVDQANPAKKMYVVTKAQNTTAVKVGEQLTQGQIDAHIGNHWTVNITA